MKTTFFHLIVCLLLVFDSVCLNAAQTTYTFTSASWASVVGTIQTDGKTDGWLSVKDGASNSNGYTDAQNRLYSAGVQVSKSLAGAGATSVFSFENVRQITVNYCTNTSKGKGTITVAVGGNETISQDVTVVKGEGQYNRDMVFELTEPQTGKITFTANPTDGSIYVRSITIRASNASPNVVGLTSDEFRLVTDANELQDGDLVIVGVSNPAYKYAMGWYDPYYSKNNIDAIAASYSADHSSVVASEEAIYEINRGTNEAVGDYWTFADADGFFLTASGGNPNSGNNNYLTAWDTIYSTSYGWYGCWDISIEPTGEATVKNLGKSRSNMIQFNPNAGGYAVFACYSTASQTPVSIYRRVVVDDPSEPQIRAGLVNFGNVLIDTYPQGSHTLTVNALNLTDDISASLEDGTYFSLDKTVLDRDGEDLVISYNISETGTYNDVLHLQSGETKIDVSIFLNAQKHLTIAEAKQQTDLTFVTLQPVVITKKYSNYVFVKDETGSMLLFDGGNENGAGYAQNRKNGDILTEVNGRYRLYYGNPEINLAGPFGYKNGEEVLPEKQTTTITEDDACRFLLLENVTLTDDENFLFLGQEYRLYDLFKYWADTRKVIDKTATFRLVAIAYNYNGMTLCPISMEEMISTALETSETLSQNKIIKYIDPVTKSIRILMPDGEEFDVVGAKIK